MILFKRSQSSHIMLPQTLCHCPKQIFLGGPSNSSKGAALPWWRLLALSSNEGHSWAHFLGSQSNQNCQCLSRQTESSFCWLRLLLIYLESVETLNIKHSLLTGEEYHKPIINSSTRLKTAMSGSCLIHVRPWHVLALLSLFWPRVSIKFHPLYCMWWRI